jgi:hypothetical protein
MVNSFINDVLDIVNEEVCDENDICLISQTKLRPDFVTLVCGHRYNYSNLYGELKNQKAGVNKYETQALKSYQLKCPYCRNIQNKILPLYKNKLELFPKLYGVNYPQKYCMYTSKCNYIFKNGKRKGLACLAQCNEKMCNRHKNMVIKERCEAILKSGVRKNQRCLKNATCDRFCSMHQNKKGD